MVSLIYYKDTVKFFDDNEDEIIGYIEDNYDEIIELLWNNNVNHIEGYKNDVLPCGTMSTGAQCMCDICYDSIDY